MNLTLVDRALMAAAYFRGNTIDQDRWTSCTDQVLTLSLFYTGDITSGECWARFSIPRYVGGLYDEDGELCEQIEARYRRLIDLLHRQPQLIEGGGNFVTPAHPTYTACRLTRDGIALMPNIIAQLPTKPEFESWPDRRQYPNVEPH